MKKLKNENEILAYYLAPEVSVLEIKTESIICTSKPDDIPGDLGGGFWL
ncbi:MAG: hypothetical protein J6Z32_00865 [Bacteroidales bacterium]|nr:hypothetical protein [Bacteroidales bacterium]